MYSVSIILSYLIELPTSPLKKAFIQTNDPLATNIVFHQFTFGDPSFVILFDDVPIDKEDLVEGNDGIRVGLVKPPILKQNILQSECWTLWIS